MGSKLSIAEILFSKIPLDQSDADKKEDTGYILKTIIEIIGNQKNTADIKKKIERILYRLDKKYQIKKELSSYLSILNLTDISSKFSSGLQFYEQVDKLFDYKDDSQLKSYLKNIYGGDASIDIKEKEVEITVTSKKYELVLPKKHIIEIGKYIEGNNIGTGNIRLHFIVFDDSDVVYEIKLAKRQHINSVHQIGKRGRKECKLKDGIYKIVSYF